jgi:hypothetical protein
VREQRVKQSVETIVALDHNEPLRSAATRSHRRPPSRCDRAAIADSQAAKAASADVEHRNGTIGNCQLPDW